MQCVLPSYEYSPLALLHTPFWLARVSGHLLPGSHFVQNLAPAAEYVPLGHKIGYLVVAVSGQAKPSGHI